MKKFMLLLAFLVSISPLFNVLQLGQLQANTVPKESTGTGEVTNLVFEQDDENGMIYTYSEDGKDYKVVEEYIDNGNAMSSEIYMEDSSGEFVILDKTKTELSESENTVVQTSEVSGEQSELSLEDEKAVKDQSLSLEDGIVQSRASAWYYHYTYNGSKSLSGVRWTVGAIAIVIAGITKVPATYRVITNMANMTFQMNVSTLYYTRHVYKDNNSPRRPNFKYITHLYRDVAKNVPVQTNVVGYNCTTSCTKN